MGNRKEITIIGHMADAVRRYQMVTPQGQSITLEAQGWNALS